MSLQLPKADDLRIVRAICHLLRKSPRGRASVTEVTSWLSESAENLFQHEWRRTRTYHYTSAAHEFGLITKPDAHVFNLTAKGRQMVRCQPELLRIDTPLNKKEKKLFIRLLPQYDAVSRFLSLFMPTGEPPLSLEEFIQSGKPVRMFKHSESTFLLMSANQEKHEIGRSEKGSFAWTLNSWLKMLDLVDDVYQETSSSYISKEWPSRVFYPLRVKTLAVEELRKLLVSETQRRNERVAIFFIPELLSTICATEGIPKLEFLSTLVELHRSDPVHFHLEMMSALRVDSRGPAYYKYLNFPEVRGVRRSHVCVSMRALKDSANE